jgi:6-phosphogluconolactonase (cycloisomerase 2 family)
MILSDGGRYLVVCNAGSNDISIFKVRGSDLHLLNTESSAGVMPISLTMYKNVLYVLNAGGDGNITGFRVNKSGKMRQIAQLPLSGSGTGPAQVGFSPDGRTLVVTEKATNQILTYGVNHHGVAYGPDTTPSSGMTPFGFAFDGRGTLVVSEAFGGAANASAVSSYREKYHQKLKVVSASVQSGQTAACWIVITGNGKYAYCTNAGTGNISGYDIDSHGKLRLLHDGISGVTGTGTSPIDMSLSKDSRYLYALNSGTMAIAIFAVRHDGTLEDMGSIGGLPAGVNGLAAR